MKFASLENSLAEEHALLALIVETFDAVEVTPRLTGIARARQLAAEAKDLGGAVSASSPDTPVVPAVPPEEPARPNWEEPMLWDAA